MIRQHGIDEESAREAIADGEFPEAMRTSRGLVAIVLTQDWCPQWTAMKRWLDEQEQTEAPEEEIDVYELEYNRASFGDEFMRFKEEVLGNRLIPYVRYYRNGELVGESNYLSGERFLSELRG